MILLSIDTCGAVGTVAMARLENQHLALLAQREIPGKTYSARLVATIREILTAHDVLLSGLDAIVVTSGPGSFTGIRIGLSTAKGLAEPASIPILAVSRLVVLAGKAGTNAAALDASRGEFYFGDGSRGIESLLNRDAFLERAALLGSKLAVCEASLHAVVPTATLVDPPTAIDAIHSVFARLANRDFDDPLLLEANYLRRSDAEIFSAPGAPPRPEPARRS
jgi:tRNA threonylcarbamoyladenosine biosynthesis protein TsaB